MCCAFNMKAADEIFSGQTYPDLVTNLQSFDKNNRSNMFRVAGAINGKLLFIELTQLSILF